MIMTIIEGDHRDDEDQRVQEPARRHPHLALCAPAQFSVARYDDL